MTNDEWTISEATLEAVDEVISDLLDDEGFFDRVLGFYDGDVPKDATLQIRRTLNIVLSTVRDI